MLYKNGKRKTILFLAKRNNKFFIVLLKLIYQWSDDRHSTSVSVKSGIRTGDSRVVVLLQYKAVKLTRDRKTKTAISVNIAV